MDYFSFDLQLFAAAYTIDLSKFSVTVTHGNEDTAGYDTTNVGEEQETLNTTKYTIATSLSETAQSSGIYFDGALYYKIEAVTGNYSVIHQTENNSTQNPYTNDLRLGTGTNKVTVYSDAECNTPIGTLTVYREKDWLKSGKPAEGYIFDPSDNTLATGLQFTADASLDKQVAFTVASGGDALKLGAVDFSKVTTDVTFDGTGTGLFKLITNQKGDNTFTVPASMLFYENSGAKDEGKYDTFTAATNEVIHFGGLNLVDGAEYDGSAVGDNTHKGGSAGVYIYNESGNSASPAGTVTGTVTLVQPGAGKKNTIYLTRSGEITGGVNFTGDLLIKDKITNDYANGASTNATLTANLTGSNENEEVEINALNPITITGDIALGAGDDTLTFTGAGAKTIKGAVTLGAGANTVSFGTGAGKVDIEGGITGGAGVDTYNLTNANNDTTITINDYGAGDKLTFDGTSYVLDVGDENTATYVVTANNNGSTKTTKVYVPISEEAATAPSFYTTWLLGQGESGETRQVIFTSDGTAKGTKYVTLAKASADTIAVTMTADAVGKVSAVDLGTETVKAALTVTSDMIRTAAGEKANTVTFSIGGRKVQLTGTTATVGYTAAVKDGSGNVTTPAAFTLTAKAMIMDATGDLSVNTLAYKLGAAKMQIEGVTDTGVDTAVLTGDAATAITIGTNTYALTADGATLNVTSGSGAVKITDGSLTMTMAADADQSSEATRVITVDSTNYTLKRAVADKANARDLTVSSTGVVSTMNTGDVFSIGDNTYEVFATALVKKDSSNAVTVFSTGDALAATSTYKEGTGLTVGNTTAAGEAFLGYNKVTITGGVLELAIADNGTRYFGTEGEAIATPASATAAQVNTAYGNAMYKLTESGSGDFVLSGGAAASTATAVTTVNVAALSDSADAHIEIGSGLNASLVSFVTKNAKAFTVTSGLANLVIDQKNADAADVITGAVALTLTGTGAKKLNFETVGAKATMGYVDGGTTATTIDSVDYHVLSNDATKTLTVEKGETANSVTVTANTNVQIGTAKYAVTTDKTTFVGDDLETGSVTINADGLYKAIDIPLEQNTDAVKITAESFKDGETTKYTTVEVVAKNGVATDLKGFGDAVGETVTVDTYTYRVATVDGANVIQRKVMGANDSTYITMKATPSGYASSIALDALTDVTQWDTTAAAYALGGTDKNELVLSDSAFTEWESGTSVFNLQKDGVTVAVLRQTAAKTFTIERGAGTDAVNISIVAVKGDTGAIIRTKGFVSTDTVKANVAKISDQDVSLTLNGTQYSIPQNVGDVSVAVTEETAGNGSKLVTGSVTLDASATNKTVTVADGSVIAVTTGSITVTAAGVVSGLTAADVFTITNADGLTTTYTVSAADQPETGKTTLTATNGYDGKYVVATANLAKITVTSTAGKSNVVTDTDGTGTVIAPVKNTNQLSVTLAEGKYVLVKVAKNGSTITGYTAVASDTTSAPAWVTRAEATDGGVIGYFQTVTDGTGKTTVTYVGDTIGMPVNLVATAINTTANMEVTADAADIEALHIEDVAAGQKVTRNGVALTENTDYTNDTKSVLGDTGTITLVADPSTNKYFKVVKDGSATNGVQKYKIEAVSSTAPAATDSYFTLTRAGSDPYTYTLTYTTPAENAEGHLALTDESWANLVIDAQNITATATNGATKIIIEPAAGISGTGWADKYTLTNAKAGVAVQEADGAKTSGYINPVVYSNAYTKEIAGGPIDLGTHFAGAKTAVYFKVTSETVNGITTVTLGAALDEAPTSTAENPVSYLAFTRNGTVITADYVNNANIPLTGLKDSTPTALQVSVVATGLTFGTDATKKQVSEIVITDDTAASKNVDYNLTGVPGGVKVTGKGDADTVTWDNTYNFDITFNLYEDIVKNAGGAAVTKKYEVTDSGTVVDGVKTLTVTQNDSPSGGYFTVTYGTDKKVGITYVVGSGPALDEKIVKNAVITINAEKLDVNGDAPNLVDITVTQGTSGPTNFVVTNLDNTVTDVSQVVKKAGTETVNYLYEYTYAADKVVLGDLQPGGTKYFVVTKATGKDAHTDMATNQSLKGVTTYTVAAGVDTVPDATANYITAKNVDGTITLTYHQSTTSASAIDLAEGGSQITVDASGLQDDADVANTITLTADANINYNVTGLPYSVTNGDADAYRKTYTLTDQAIALTNNSLGTTVYYAVTAGAATRGRAAVTLAQKADREELADLGSGTHTENEIATKLKTMNYFTVTTSAAGVVSITYTEAETGTAIKLSDATGYIGVNANGTTADKITGITIEQGGDANYQLQNLRGATTITKTDEGSTVTVDNYVPTYVIDGKIELSATGTGIVYYDLVRTESDTKIVTYKLGAAATTHAESNYFAVNYNAVDQGKVFVSYVNVGTDEYDLDDVNKVGLGKVGIDATSLPKGVATIDISERGKSGDCEVRYEITGVPATAEVVDATHGVTGDTVTKALDYAFKANEKITVYASSTGDVITYIKSTDVTTNGVKTGETYTFDGTALDNVGSVKITKATAGGAATYTVEYTAGSTKDPVKLSGGQIALDASTITDANVTIVKKASDTGSYAITGAKGDVTFKSLATDGSDTVKYSTTFAYADGTYFAAMADNIVLKTGLDAVVPAAGTTYLAVTLDNANEKVSYAWMTPNEKNGVMEKLETAPTFTGRVTLTARATAWTGFDASGFDGLGVDIVDVPDGAVITKLGDDTTVTMTATSTNDDMTVAGKKYMAGDASQDDKGNYTNAIKVSGDGVVSGIVKITKQNDTTQTLTAANKKSGATTAETVWIETVATDPAKDGVIVTFGANGIESIKGLDAGEVVRIREKDGIEYVYTTTDGLLITRTSAAAGSTPTYLGLDKAGSEFFSGTYGTKPDAVSYTTGFEWKANTSTTPYYMPVANGTSGTGIDGTATINTGSGGDTKTATAGEYLLAVTMTESNGIFTMNVTPMVVDGTQQIVAATGDAAFTGTVTLDMAASSAKPVILDVTGKTYVLDVDNAKAGSTFTGLGAIVDATAVAPVAYADTVDTADLAKGESVTVNGAVYTNASDTARALAFANADPTNKDTKYWGLNAASGTQLLVTAASGTLTAINQGETVQTVSYAAGTVSDGAVVTFNSGAADAVTSIEGLTGGESVTVTKDGVTKVYTANTDGTVITLKETAVDGTVITKTYGAKSGETVTAGQDVLTITWSTLDNTITNTLDWTKDSIGYFKVVNNVATVAAGETTISSADNGTHVVAAKVALDAKTGVATLTLTGGTVGSKGEISAYSLLATDVVKVTLADGTLVNYTKATAASVQITGAKAGSVFTDMALNTDQVTTAALALNDAIFFNKTKTPADPTDPFVITPVISAAADNTLTIAGNSSDSSHPRIVAGSVQVGGKYAGSDEAVKTALGSTLAVSTTAYGSDNVVSVVYTAGTKDTEAKDGVIATFTNGNPTSITGLTNGEKVVVTYKNNDTYTYTATNEAGTEITCVFVDGSGDTSKNWTRYCTTMTTGGNILDGTYANTTTTSIFNWSATKEATATSATGYFEISAADGTTTVLDQAAASTSTVIEAGDKKHYVDVTATKDAAGVVTISKIGEVVVGIDGTISDVQDAGGEGILKRVTLQLPAGTGNVGTVVKANIPADRTEVPAFTATNVGNGSVIGGNLTAADQIVTATGFATGNTITVGDKTYIAGADNTTNPDEQLKVYGDGKVEDGTLKLNTRADKGLSEVTTYYVDAGMNRISETISYASTETGSSSGAVVTIANGVATGLTSLGANESVTIVQTTTDKNGIASVVTTTYSAALDDYDNLVYTRTVDDNGVKKVSTSDTASAATDLIAAGGWSTSSTTAKSQFDWTNTGFFLLGENKYDGTVTLATQDTATSINKSKAWNVYLKVTSTGNSAKGYTISAMNLVYVNSNGDIIDTTPSDKVTVNVTAPSAGVDFGARSDANIVLNVTGATAGRIYNNLATGDTISFSGVADKATMSVNGTTFTSGAASNEVTLKKTAGGFAVGKGTLLVKAGEDYASSATNGATVAVTGGDGVIVTYGSDGHISSVTDLEDTETVTVTETNVETIWEKNGDPSVVVTKEVAEAANKAEKEAAEKEGRAAVAVYLKRVVTTTIAKAYTAGAKKKDGSSDISVTVTTTVGETLTNPLTGVVTDPVAAADMKNVVSRTETWTKKAVAATDDVISLTGYTTANVFDWGNGKTGYFAITENAATVEKQTAAPEISTTATYLKVVTNAASTEAAAVADQIVALTYDTTLNAWVETDFTGTVTIPATGGLDISAITNRAREAYNINVTNAGTGKTFTGFTKDDTITTATTFYKDNSITVNGETLTAAADGQIVVSGEGKAISGTFKLQTAGAGDSTIVLPKDAAGNTYTVAYTLPTTGTDTATVVVKDGAIQAIRDIASGETVTVTITDANGKVVTEEYAATAGSGADETKITKTVVDGVTTTTSTATLKASEKYSDIYGAAYTESSKTTVSQFAWTNVADGYFVPTFDSEKNTYTATIAPQASPLTIPGTAPATVYKAGDKFLKVTRTKATATENQTITAISLVELQSDGSFRDVTSNLGTGSTVAITLPSDTAITYAKAAGALYGVQLSVPATGSKITGLKAVDAIGTNAESKAEAGKAFGILSGTTLEATGMTVTTAAAAMNVHVNGMHFISTDAAGLTIQANTASDTFLTKGTLTLNTNTTVIDNTKSTFGTNPDSAVMIQKLVKAVAPATEDTTGDKIIVTAADLGQDSTVTVDIYGSFDATTLTSAAAQGLTLTATNTSGTVIEKYAVDYYGNITATNAAGSTKYYLAAAPTGKIILDGTIDSTFDNAALVADAPYDSTLSGYKVTLLDNSRTTYYATQAGERLLSATYTKAATEGAKDTYAIAGLTGNNVKEIDTTALTSDKVTIDSTNLTAANIKLTDATGTTAVVKLASGTMTLEAGAISGVTALTLVSGELVNASGITALTIEASKATVNGVAYKGAQNAVVTAAKDGESYTSQLVSGGVTVATGDEALKLSGGSTVTATGSVTVEANAGAVSQISDFQKGEKVAIRTGTTTTTYEAISETNIKVTTQPDSGTATTAMATLTGSSFNLPLATYEALTTEAGDIDWASTTAKTTYRLVPAAGSTVDLSAASKQSSFSYADVGKNLYATTVTAGTNTLTVTVKEIVVDEKGALTTDASSAKTAEDAGRFTLTTGTLTKGTTVTLNGASTVGQPHTYMTAKDSALTVEGDGVIVNGALVLGATALKTKESGSVTLGGTAGSTQNAVTVTNGKVTAIAGLDVGESVVIGDATDNVTYTAQTRVVEGETIYEIVKTVTKGGVIDTAATATATVTKETMANEFSLAGGLAFTGAAQDVTTEIAGQGQGQFQWTTADTRGVGYFLIQKAAATKTPASITVADQASKTVFTTKESGNTYMVASLVNGELTLSAQRATVNAAGDEVTFSDTTYAGTVKITVAKDYTGALAYDAPSDRPYNVEFSNVTAGAALTNLGKGLNGLVDKVTTVALAENDVVTVNGIAYTAGAKGALTFQNGKLYSGTVKLSATTASDSLVTTGNEKKGTPSMTVSGANFVGDDTNEVLVKVANGEITSITGLVNATESITVTAGTTEYVYSVLDSAGTMIKRESDGSSVYTTIKTGGNVYVTKDTAWNPGVTFGPGGNSAPKNTTMTADSKVWSGNTVRYYKIGASANLTNGFVAELVTSATEGVQGEYYIAVTAKETKTGAQITGVTLMQVSATGELKKASTTLEKAFNGWLNIEAETALTYSATATRNWHFNITGVKDGTKITNLNAGDFVTTGDVSYQGTVTVDSLKYVSGDKTATQTMEITGGKPDTVMSSGVFAMSNGAKTLTTTNGLTTYTVKYGGGKDELAVTVSNGQVTAITGLGTTAASGTVTLEKVNALGKETTTYTLKNGVITRTVTDVAGKEITTTATNTSTFDLIGGEYNDDAKLKDVAYNFTWTDAGTTGYFKVANLAKAATVKTAKGTIKTTDTASNYLAVTLANAGAAWAEIASIQIQRMVTAENAGMTEIEGLAYTGALTLTVPKGVALTFDRTILGESMENAKIAVTGIAAGSEIKNLKTGETVTTGALAENASVNVNGSLLQAGAKNATLKVTSIDTANVKVDSGKVKLVADNTTGYVEEITVAKDKNTTCIVGVTKGEIVVNATATGFTVEGLGAGEEFTVTEGTTTVSYKVSENTLLRVKDSVTSIYKMSAATIAKGTASITSAVLNKESNWLTSTAYASDAHKAATARAKIDLKAADTALTKAEKAGTIMPDYYFVTDEDVDQKTIATKNGVIVTTMVETTSKQAWELKIGAATTDDVTGDGVKDRVYTASDTVGQNIIAAAGWSVVGGSGADTITGAASGKDTLAGGSGDDSMVGGGANDYFIHTDGKDVIKNYTSGKDKVSYEGGFDTVTLGKADVTLGASDTNTLVLINAAASQANGVTIQNDGAEATYYFGKSTAAANFTKLTDGAYYYGQAGQKNKITLSTDKTKATKTALGANQTVDLYNDAARFQNITEVNASGSANKVYLRANNAATTDMTTLRGGSYMTTLVGGQGTDAMFGGSGNDFFQFNEYSGTDVISKYDGKKDTLYVAGGLGYWEISDNKHLYLKASAADAASIKLENVVGGTAVNIAEDSLGNNVTSYFFGKANAANTYTGTDDASKGAAKHHDVFIVNQYAKATTVKLFGIDDEIQLTVSDATKYDSVQEIMAAMQSSSGANSIYSIDGQKLTISDKSYSMSTANTEVTTSGNIVTIKRTK